MGHLGTLKIMEISPKKVIKIIEKAKRSKFFIFRYPKMASFDGPG
jgi:hypothetical protein